LDKGCVAGTEPVGNVVLDLDGVVYLGGEAIPGAAEALEELTERGYVVVFATNNSTRTAESVAAHVRETVGYAARTEQVVTSGMAAATLAREGDGPAFVLGEEGLAETLQREGIAVTGDPSAARSVFVGLDWGLTYERLRDATTAVLGGARFIATNVDVTFPTPEGLWPGAGTIAAALAAAAGRRPEVAGKPHEAMRRAVAARLGPGPTWMVGDRPETDIAFGNGAGWTTVLVLTGVAEGSDDLHGEHRPVCVVESVASLPGLLR
jgi:4-nitrophenyl phosphatase